MRGGSSAAAGRLASYGFINGWLEFYTTKFDLTPLAVDNQISRPVSLGPYRIDDEQYDRVQAILMSGFWHPAHPEYPAFFAAITQLAELRGLPLPPHSYTRSHILHALRAGFYSYDEVMAIMALAAPSLLP